MVQRLFFLMALISLMSSDRILSQAVAITTDNSLPHASAILDLKADNKGLLIPRLTEAQRVGIASPAAGLMVYDITSAGVWLFNGSAWQKLASGLFTLLEDADGDTQIQVEESPDENTIRFDLDGTEYMVLLQNAHQRARLELSSSGQNLYIGVLSGEKDSSGMHNVGIGYHALKSSKTGKENTAIGALSFSANKTGEGNVAIGKSAMQLGMSGHRNTALGVNVLYGSTADDNTGIGNHALYFNAIGTRNTAIGKDALRSNVGGSRNVAIGASALFLNSDYHDLIAIGDSTLYNNGVNAANSAHARGNIAIGTKALYKNDIGYANIGMGRGALHHNSIRNELVAIGDSAMHDLGLVVPIATQSTQNTAIGTKTLRKNSTGQRNTAVGYRSQYSTTIGSSNTSVGALALEKNISGYDNTAIGSWALVTNTTGVKNTAVGAGALNLNNGLDNTAIGVSSILLNGDGDRNTAVGSLTMVQNQNTSNNTAIGYAVLRNDTSGYENIGVGSKSLWNNLSGYQNTSVGTYSMENNKTGVLNTVLGYKAMLWNSTGNTNTIIGAFAGQGADTENYSGNVFIGYGAGYTEKNNNRLHISNSLSGPSLIYGDFAVDFVRINGSQEVTSDLNVLGDLSVSQNVLFLDDPNINKTGVVLRAFGDEAIWYNDTYFSWGFGGTYNYFSDDIRLGGGGGLAPTYQLQLSEDSAGKPGGGSWTNPSDQRLKKNIRDYTDGLSEVLRLRPVYYQYNEASEYDTAEEYVGVLAQELQEIAPYMVSENKTGFLDVNNSAMTYMLINAVKTLAAENENLKSEIARHEQLLQDILAELALMNGIKTETGVSEK